MKRSLFVSFASVVLAMLAPAVLHAGVIRVPTDVTTVRVAVANSAPGDTVQIVGNGGATYEESDVRIDKDLTIQGGWRVDFQVRDPDTYVSVIRDTSDLFDRPLFRITGPYRVVFEGLWLWGGRHAVFAENGSDLVVRDCIVRNQRFPLATSDFDTNRGGAFRILGGSALFERSRIHNIIVAYSGAAIAATNASSVVLRDVEIDNCVASRTVGDASGGAIYIRNVSDFRVERTTMITCATVQSGGLIFIRDSAAMISDSNFLRGLASTHGGALFVLSSDVTFERCRFEECRAIQGGAIHAEGGSSVTVRDSRFFFNRALDQGGAFWSKGGTFDFARTEFETNHVAGSGSAVIPSEGGAAYTLSSSGQVTDCSFLGERSRGKGGAWFHIGGDLGFLRTRFEGNDAAIFGGALAIELGGKAIMDNCLMVRNSAKFGGAVAASFTGAIDLNHCTLTEGTGRSAGGGVYVDTGGQVRMTDTIACCCLQGEVAYCAGGAIIADHTDAWNDDALNVRVEWGGGCPDPTGTDGNIKANPQFCAGDPDYHVALASPCAGTASDGSDRGWLPATTCTPTAPLGVESLSWGRVKASWR